MSNLLPFRIAALFSAKTLLTLFIALASHQSAEGNDQIASYLEEVKPLFARKCVPCHGALKQESGLRLDTIDAMLEAEVLVPTDPEMSSIVHRIRSTEADVRMPPEGEPITEEERKRLEQWISEGAIGPRDETPPPSPNQHWAFQPIQISSGISQENNENLIDHFIEKSLKRSGLNFAEPADPTTLCRRLHLDLHGLPPTPQQISSFLSEFKTDPEEAIRHQTRLLLASPRYGERWAQYWLDIVRYADTHGFEVNTPRENAWPYRDYVIKSFQEDKPFDQFIREQIVGDQLNQDAATGFLVAAPVLLPGQIGKDDASKRLARQDSLDEIIVSTSASFLGLTVGCARCHDHKFDPISQEDYYSFQAFFAGVKYGERVNRDANRLDEERKQKTQEVSEKIGLIQSKINALYPDAFLGRTIVIDDEDISRTTTLRPKNGHGVNPAGTDRGYINDPGDILRYGNLSRGRYTWWDNHSGEDVFTWNPEVNGKFHLWISWGVHGSGVHTRDARYVIDLDGDLHTETDQKEIAIADQYYFAGQTQGESEKKPLWSGLRFAGTHDLTARSRLILRGGDSGTGITADVIVLQDAIESSLLPSSLPRLRQPVSPQKNRDKFTPTLARFVRFTSLQTIDQNRHQPCIDELEIYSKNHPGKNLALASEGVIATSSGNYSDTGKHQLKHINDGSYGNERSWISNEFGRGWVQLELPSPTVISEIVWGRDRNAKFSDRLSVKYRVEISLDENQWETVASSEDRLPVGTPNNEPISIARLDSSENRMSTKMQIEELHTLQRQYDELTEPKRVYAGIFDRPTPTPFLRRGDPEQPQHPCVPKTPEIFEGFRLSDESNDPERRLALAEWIASPDNPLTARVIANRIWQFHFGTGLVDTPSDFGMNGAKPSHPELLDWLANELIRNDWSIHHLHRTITESKTYQQAAKINPQAQAIDADCRLLWRFPSRRLEAEAIRDSILSVSGELNLEMGGPGFNFFQSRGGLNGFPPVQNYSEKELRRMIYAHKIRMEPAPIFGAFDCPDAGQPTAKRGRSTTAIQALNLFNSPFIRERGLAFSERIISNTGDNIDHQIEYAFLLALGRKPNAVERNATIDTVLQHGLPTLCRVLFNSNEFLFLP